MNSIFQNINYLRYPQSFDYSKIPIINNKHKLSFDPQLAPNNWIDELRVANHIKNPPRPRVIPEIDLIEQERLLRYGERVDIGADTLVERFGTMTIKVPLRDVNGNIMNDPTSGKPIMRMMSFTDMLKSPGSLLFRVNELITNINQVPANILQQNVNQNVNLQNFQQNTMTELLIIQQHLLNIIATGKLIPTVITTESIQAMDNTDVALINIFQQVESDKARKLRLQIFTSNVPYMVSPTEITQMQQRTPLLLGMVYGLHMPDRPSVVIPSFIAFVSERYGQQDQFNFATALLAFQTTGGVQAWAPQARQIMARLPQMEIEAAPEIELEPEPVEEPEEKPITEEDPEETEDEPADITGLFMQKKIDLPRDGQFLNEEWYKTIIGPNVTKRENFKQIIGVMKSVDNTSYLSFTKLTGTPSINNLLSANSILNGVRSGKFKIQKVGPSDYQLKRKGTDY